MSYEFELYSTPTPSTMLTQIENSSGRFGTLQSTPGTSGEYEEEEEIPPGVSERIAKRQVIHPVFRECMQLTNDMFWRSIFFMAARGKFPSGFRFNNGFLNYKKKNNTDNVFIPPEPNMALEVFTNFMHQAGITSNMDVEHQNERMAYSCSTKDIVSPTTWTQVPKNLRSHYVNSYIRTVAVTYKLSQKAKASLMTLVHNNIDSGVLGKDQIQVSEFKITNILGIVYVQEEDRFKIDDAIWARIRMQHPRGQYMGSYNPNDYFNGIGGYKTDGQKWRTQWGKKAVCFSNLGNTTMKVIGAHMMKESMEREALVASGAVILLEDEAPVISANTQFVIID